MKIRLSLSTYIRIAIGVVVAVVAVVAYLRLSAVVSTVGLERSTAIDITPQQIQSIRDIGQWEFLAVSDEELIDTTKRGLLSGGRLARIYYGTMRLGVDMNKVGEDWLTVRGDTVVLLLPPVGLLDERFIDEARTVAFYESGKWTAADREAMYQRARRRMLVHGLSPQNLRSAQDNADAQFRQLLRSMGFQNIIIRFRE